MVAGAPVGTSASRATAARGGSVTIRPSTSAIRSTGSGLKPIGASPPAPSASAVAACISSASAVSSGTASSYTSGIELPGM